ncbi:hypothetical protein [Tsukamurella soli]|uniref:Uncharacterized protein n=1 Tax=Tsukamurella soli TaxID=644556 RepID=A0ABP8JJ97_9ACTN
MTDEKFEDLMSALDTAICNLVSYTTEDCPSGGMHWPDAWTLLVGIRGDNNCGGSVRFSPTKQSPWATNGLLVHCGAHVCQECEE